MDGWWERGGRARSQGVFAVTNRSDPRYLVLLAVLLAAAACEDREAPPASDRPAPIPTTPEHRKPMTASEVKRFEAIAAQQIQQHKEALVAACSEPKEGDAGVEPGAKVDPESLKRAAAGSSKTVTVMIVFDEEGNEATREVIDEAEVATGVARCVGENLPPVTVPPPKRKVRVKVPLKLP